MSEKHDVDWLAAAILGWFGFIALLLFRDRLSELAFFAVAAVSVIVFLFAIGFVGRFFKTIRNRLVGRVGKPVDRFWAPFAKPNVEVALGNYTTKTASVDSEVARNALRSPTVPEPRFYSMAMVRTFGHLSARLDHGRLPRTISSTDFEIDFEPERQEWPLIIVGSEANNYASSAVMSILRDRYDFHYKFTWNDDTQTVDLTGSQVGQVLRPSTDAEAAVDYALVVRATIAATSVLMISGCHVHGTEGASAAITSEGWIERWLSRVPREDENIAFVLKVSTPADRPAAMGISKEDVELVELLLLAEADDVSGQDIHSTIIDLTTKPNEPQDVGQRSVDDDPGVSAV